MIRSKAVVVLYRHATQKKKSILIMGGKTERSAEHQPMANTRVTGLEEKMWF